jgi:hypothetical protein
VPTADPQPSVLADIEELWLERAELVSTPSEL